MIIDSIRISNYRSFDPEGILIENPGNINVFIGKNNVGKSNILYFLKLISDNIGDLRKMPVETIENRHRRTDKNAILTLSFKVVNLKAYYSHLSKIFPDDKVITLMIDIKSQTIELDNSFDIPSSQLIKLQSHYSSAPDETLRQEIKKILLSVVMAILKEHFEKLIYIPHFREIYEEPTGQVDYKIFNGQNIISQLYHMQVPKFGSEKEREKFDEIQQFVREQVGDKTLKLEIPPDKEAILIEMHGNRLPLKSFGTGIHEILILCSVLALYKGYTVCIEEPEIHMHPDLQKAFLKFIHLHTNNTYFISSHSNVFLDYKGVNIYHVTHDGICSKATKTSTDDAAYDILDDLGYKASNLLQANSIIWVEGPSDRVFLNKWINMLEPALIEGFHYSIMFYGGKLLAHLTMNNENETNMIKLLRINRNSIIIIDRDGQTDESKINETKTRIESETTRGICWITKGREIENYMSGNTLTRYISSKTNKEPEIIFKSNMKLGEVLEKNGKIKYDQNKVKYAKEIVEFIELGDLNILDLRDKLDAIILRIKQWNNIA